MNYVDCIQCGVTISRSKPSYDDYVCYDCSQRGAVAHKKKPVVAELPVTEQQVQTAVTGLEDPQVSQLMKLDNAGYWLWRRDDGYVGCTRYEPRSKALGEFTILATSDVWDDEFVAKFEAERLDPRHIAVVASWEVDA